MSLEAVQFKELVEYVINKNQYWGADKLAIWGGRCRPDKAATLLEKWGLPDEQMPYCLWETSSDIRLAERAALPNVDDLERGRIFGKSGDLSLRRDGNLFSWHFIGSEGTKPPDTLGDLDDKEQEQPFNHMDNDFWQTEPKARFLRREETALLWGERKAGQGRWFEDRVAWAKLQYTQEKWKRVQIHYDIFSRAGVVEFVWLTHLSQW